MPEICRCEKWLSLHTVTYTEWVQSFWNFQNNQEFQKHLERIVRKNTVRVLKWVYIYFRNLTAIFSVQNPIQRETNSF